MLEIKRLSIAFERYGGWLARTELHPIRCLDVEIEKGQVVSIVGESGAGKSLLAHAVLGLLPGNAKVSGRIQYAGQELTPERIRMLRGREIAFIPQSVGFLNPLWRVGGQVVRAARLGGKNSEQAVAARDGAFARYNLPDAAKVMFPYQISGGMARRVLTAAATVGEARLIVADEITTMLDALTQARIWKSLLRYAEEHKISILVISHDTALLKRLCTRIIDFEGLGLKA
jgi:peptide/nickel transport system ATP-binding protein